MRPFIQDDNTKAEEEKKGDKSEDGSDLEFVAENLSLTNDGSNGVETALAVPASRPEHDHMIERLKREHQVHQQEARDLKT